jgi:hypothetical protein
MRLWTRSIEAGEVARAVLQLPPPEADRAARTADALGALDARAEHRSGTPTALPRAAYDGSLKIAGGLYKKGILSRARRGHAMVYTPVMGRQEFHATVARHVLAWLRVSGDYR